MSIKPGGLAVEDLSKRAHRNIQNSATPALRLLEKDLKGSDLMVEVSIIGCKE